VRIPLPVLVLAVLTFFTLGIAAFRVNRPVVPPSGNTGSVRESKPAIALAVTDGQSGPSQGSPTHVQEAKSQKNEERAGRVDDYTLSVPQRAGDHNLLTSPEPVYPGDARAGALEGVVRLQVRIGTDGRISDTTVLSGNPTLTTAAIEAVKKRVYRPTLLNGMPIAVITQVDVTFRMEVILTSSLMH
jgi:TonB family protein